MRFSLKWLLIAVAFIAVSLVALLNANQAWQLAWRNIVLFTLLVAVAGTLWSAGEKRAVWGGYLLFGLPYFAMATEFFGVSREAELPSTRALSAIHARVFVPKSETILYGVKFEGGDIVSEAKISQSGGSATVMVVRPQNACFVGVGNVILCIPFGVIGSLTAAWFYRQRTEATSSP